MIIVHDLLSNDLFVELRRHSRVTKLMRTNTTSWDHEIVGWSTPILNFDIEGELLARCHKELHRRFTQDYHNIEHWHASIHLGGRMSYIPWHNDATHKWNITCYLNEDWRPEYEGYFIYEEDGPRCLRAILPARNLGLIYETPLMHTVAMSNFNAPLRESLQIFINAGGGHV